MIKLNSKWLITAALATTLVVAGCGGGGGGGGGVVGSGGGGGGQVAAPLDPATSASGVIEFLLALIANETTDLSEPKPSDGITFATDDLAEPSAI